jgi:hypothetical protein
MRTITVRVLEAASNYYRELDPPSPAPSCFSPRARRLANAYGLLIRSQYLGSPRAAKSPSGEACLTRSDRRVNADLSMMMQKDLRSTLKQAPLRGARRATLRDQRFLTCEP